MFVTGMYKQSLSFKLKERDAHEVINPLTPKNANS